jgi:hypothetical protein
MRLEPDAVKVARPVLREERRRKAPDLPDRLRPGQNEKNYGLEV